MKSLADLQALREKAKQRLDLREGETEYRVVVGMATCGITAGARPVLNRCVEEVAAHHYPATVTQTGCLGMCTVEPIVEVYDKDGKKTTYVHMTPDKVAVVLREHIGFGEIVEEFTINGK